ncbi:hypothetical protein SOVF_128700 isoform A [Spinacia oleracea]|uniref:B3 domain-containing protein Os01g0234100 isoform X2 n=1 Tax=Spinacia oleracea TaxID=3562 RepID=A0A9R0INI5_SPIOL|nr:B3 domain-containing protein Os01g0234100-like isoform X2 [Spinacia oleracea]KNA12124.1 hypothetical protein SOVF_128700 isoform A [Spinacia oleracea]
MSSPSSPHPIPVPFQAESSKLLKNKRSNRNSIKRTWSHLIPCFETGLRHQHRKPKRRRPTGLESADKIFKSAVINQAEEFQSKLDPEYPSFVKALVKSHVTGCFWMRLPAPFCQTHLPVIDTFFTLETHSKKLYKAKYLASRQGLSGGWKGFAVSERLLEGDALVFHLISDTKFKVYVIKENNLTEVDGTLSSINLNTHEIQSDPGIVDQTSMQPPQNSESNSTGNSGRVVDGFPIYEEATLSPNTVSTFENFSIVINDLLKDYELPRHIKWSYYKLCCSQDALLHEQLPQWMNHILVGGIIIETVTIADALRQCELSTPKEEFAVWDKTLSALELLGMNVGFLRTHQHRLQRIVHDPEVAIVKQKCLELCAENSRAEDEIRSLTARLVEMKKVHIKRATDIDNLKSKLSNHEIRFQELVHTPW